MIHLAPKAKAGKKPKKKVRKVSSPVAQTDPQRDDGFTAEDIAEINMFSAAIDKMNWQSTKKNWAKTVAEWKKFQGAKHKA